MPKTYLTRCEAADHLQSKGVRYTAATLAKLASTKQGPLFTKIGRRALYRADDLDSWVEEKAQAGLTQTKP